MANRFLNNIRINDEYTLPAADGTADQIITTDGAGQLSFVNQDTINSGSAERTEILVKNVHGSALSKGDPVYIVGTVGASDRLEVALADAGNAAKMPCVGLLTQDLANNGEGTATVTGKLRNLITSPIDGATPTENDTLYVKSGGGLTLTKPTGSANLIQNVGQVGRVSTSADGNIVVSAILRSNDVPNLPTGKIWVGTTANTAASGVVHLDEGNSRMGINTTSPGTSLQVNGTGEIIRLNDTNATANPYLTFYQNGTRRSYVQHVDSGDNFTLGSEYGGIRFLTGTGGIETEKMRILSNGNVGIGTPSPGAKLDVKDGSSAMRFQEYSNGASLFLDGADGDFIGGDYFNISAYGATDLAFGYGAVTKMVMKSTGNVGIGTTSPQEQLHLYGGNLDTRELGTSTAANVIYLNTKNGPSGGGGTGIGTGLVWAPYYSGYTKRSAGIMQIAEGNYFRSALAFYTNNTADALTDWSERMRISMDGNVGIGTTSPSGSLHIQNGASGQAAPNTIADGLIIETSSSSSAGMSILSPSSTSGNIFFGDESDNYVGGFRYYHNVNEMSINVNNAEALRIDSSRNVGIGTTSPSYKLSVNGNIQTDIINGYTYPNNSWLDFDYDQTLASNMVALASIGTIVYLADTNNNSSASTSAHLFTTGNGDVDSATRLLNISNNGAIQFNQYGSGTFTGTATQRLGVDSSGNVIEIPIGSGPVDGSGTANYVTKWSDADTIGNSIIYDNGTFVGIGTTSPEELLHIKNGDAGVTPYDLGTGLNIEGTTSTVGINIISSNTGQGRIYFASPSSNTAGAIEYNHDATLSNGFMKFRTGNSERMRIDGSGNVGIGETSIDARMHITTASSGLVNQKFESAGSAAWRVGIPASQTYFAFDNANDNLSAPKVVINSSGNVGIGTTSPDQKLEVAGNVILDSSNANLKIKAGVTGTKGDIQWTFNTDSTVYASAGITYDNRGTDGFLIDSGYPITLDFASSHLRFSNNGSEKMRINTSGNVGIGTTSPDYKLDVAGAIGINTYIHHNGDTDTFIGYSANDTFDVNAGGVKQLTVTSDNVNITDTLSYTYPTATGEYNGEIVTFGTFDTKNGTILEGDVIVYTTAGLNSGWMKAQGNVTYSKGMLGIAMGTSASDGVLIKGFARNAAFASGGLGSPLYLSPTSAGDTTSTVPSSTNNIVRIVGYMLNPTNDEIFFDPDKSWVQVS
jgi:hypothetical protein